VSDRLQPVSPHRRIVAAHRPRDAG
jgi:hypothetical protein